MKTTYNSTTRRVYVALTLKEANTLDEILNEYYATTEEDFHTKFALELAKALTGLPAVMQHFRNRS